MKAIVLAAGMGQRLGAGLPKALYTFEGHRLIDYILKSLELLNIEEIIVVGGYHFPLLQEHLKSQTQKVRLLENRDFSKGSIVTLSVARPFVTGEFFLFNSDHLYPVDLLKLALKNASGIMAICDEKRLLGDDDMKVQWDHLFRLQAISKKLPTYQGGYIGLTYCSAEASPIYWKAFDKLLVESHGNAVVEEILRALINTDTPPSVKLIDPFQWIEIDTPEDAELGKEKIRSGKVNLTSPFSNS